MASFGGLLRDVARVGVGAARAAPDVARAVPGVRFFERQLRGAERVVLRELSARIEEATGEHAIVPRAATPQAQPRPRIDEPAPTPVERLERLLKRSMDQTPDESNLSLVEVVLQSIVPDEARILSALSDGSPYPVVHVNTGSVGRATRRVLSNASSVGRAAGVALPDRVPAYLSHLEQLGLIEIGPEDTSLGDDEYEILMTDATVRRARDRVNGGRVRFARQSVRISDLGKEFWHTVRPSG